MRRPAGAARPPPAGSVRGRPGHIWRMLQSLCALALTSACGGVSAAGVTPMGVVASSTPLPPGTAGVPTSTLAPTPVTRSILTPSVTRQPTVTPWLNQARTAPTPISGMADIDVEDYYFYPDVITVTAGTTVRWVPVGSTQHSIVPRESPASWPGGVTAGLGSPAVEWTFKKPGTYRYFCDYHPGAMDAVVIVVGE